MKDRRLEVRLFIHANFPSMPCSTNSPTQRSKASWSIVPCSSKKALKALEDFVRPFARRDLPPFVDRTYDTASWYEGELAGEGESDFVEEESVEEESCIRSLII